MRSPISIVNRFARLSLLALLVFFLSCKKQQPKACFTPSATSAYTKDTIHFTNCSEEAGKYQWAFGDGNGSSLFVPTHAYQDTGWFTITLNARSKSYYNANASAYSVKVHIRKGVRGCMDPASCNYNPKANIDDNSCQFSGRHTFWISNPAFSFVEMNVDGAYVGTISQHYASIPQGDCATIPGCVRIETCTGVNHTYQGIVYDQTGTIIKTVSGTFSISAGVCELFEIS